MKTTIENKSTEKEITSVVGNTDTAVVNVRKIDKETGKPVAVEQATEQKVNAVQATDSGKYSDVQLTKDDVKLINGTTVVTESAEYNFESKSKMFKWLHTNCGMSVAKIAKLSNSHYSFVYGVLQNADILRQEGKQDSKSDEIRKLASEGKTPGEIAKLLNSNYSFVHTVVKKFRETLTVKEA